MNDEPERTVRDLDDIERNISFASREETFRPAIPIIVVNAHSDPLVKARKRRQKAKEEVQKAAVGYSLGELTDEQFQAFLLEHYKAQMEMSQLMSYWPWSPT